MKKNKKIIILVISIIIGVIIVIGGYFVIENTILNIEKNRVNKVLLDKNLGVKTENENIILNRTITIGKYKKMEKAYKNYAKDIVQNIDNISKILKDDKMKDILTIENFQKDGKEFTQTKIYIAGAKQVLLESEKKYTDLLDENGALQYIKKETMNEGIRKEYKKMIGNLNEIKQKQKIKTMIGPVIKMLEKSQEVIDFLIKNKESWQIQADRIQFVDFKLNEKYEQLVSEIYK